MPYLGVDLNNRDIRSFTLQVDKYKFNGNTMVKTRNLINIQIDMTAYYENLEFRWTLGDIKTILNIISN